MKNIDLTFITNEVLGLPVLKLALQDEKKISYLVDQILTAKKQDPNADTSAREWQIDKMIYKLYGLTEEEIEIVEWRK